MTPRRVLFVATAIILALTFTGRATLQEAAPPEYGPAKGSLVIVGGGGTDGTGIMEKFVELAGGNDAKIIVVPTAGGNRAQDGSIRVYKEEEVIAGWLKRGLKNVKMLHTHDPKVADTEVFVKDLRQANAVWFNGGRQWNIVDSYAGTLTYKEFHKVLERGGVIGGSSAGATIQGSYLLRGAPEGNRIMMSPGHEEGFGFLRAVAIDQHVNTRGRAEDLRPVLEKHRELLGIALDEATAILVQGDACRVMGAGSVRFFATPDAPAIVLKAGDRYDLAARMPSIR